MDHLDPNDVAAWIDGELEADERPRVEAHLADCAACRQRLVAQVRARESMPAAPGGRWHGGGLRPILLVAAALGAVLLGIGIYRSLDRGVPAVAERGGGPPTERIPRRASPGGAASTVDSPAVPPPAPATVPEPAPERRPAGAREGPAEPGVDPTLLALRGATREAGGKTFRLEDGVWVDDGYRAAGRPAAVDLRRGSEAFRSAVQARPEIADYAAVGPAVLVIVDSRAYRILTEEAAP